MQPNRISVVVTLYNKRNYVRRAVESILSQRQSPFEVIVVDDGSTDGGAATLESFVRPGLLRIVHQANAGEGAARNRGVREAKGELIAMLDADDQWDPEFLSAIGDLADLYPNAGIFATGYRTVFTGGLITETTLTLEPHRSKVLVQKYFAEATRAQFVWISAQAIRSDVYRAIGGYLEGAPLGCDLDLLGRIALRYPVAYDCRILATYRNDAGGRIVLSQRKKPQEPPFVKTAKVELLRAGRELPLPDGLKSYLKVLLTRYAFQLGGVGDRKALIALLESEPDIGTAWDRAMLKCGCALRLQFIPAFWQRAKTSRWFFDLEWKTRRSNGATQRRARKSGECGST
jgi:glycosyltransferase involved in cell wall biosynthesis